MCERYRIITQLCNNSILKYAGIFMQKMTHHQRRSQQKKPPLNDLQSQRKSELNLDKSCKTLTVFQKKYL